MSSSSSDTSQVAAAFAQTGMLAQESAVPVAQARRCLDLWLEEEQRHLPERLRRRAAGLLARYFLYEDSVTDELLLSFLRHYAGFRVIDMDDPASVRGELKSVLDSSVVREPPPPSFFSVRHYILALAVLGCCLLAALHWLRPPAPINLVQEAQLKTRVERLTSLDPTLKPVTVWARLRAPFGVSRYRELTTEQFAEARAMLDQWIEEQEKALLASAAAAGAGAAARAERPTLP